jgi:hypothetical protein
MRKVTVSFVVSVRLSVCPHVWNKSAVTGQIFMKFKCLSKIGRENSSFGKILTTVMGTLNEDLCTFMIVFWAILLTVRSVSDRKCRENQNTRFIFKTFVRTSCCLWDNVKKIRYSQTGHIYQYSTLHTHCMLDKRLQTHTQNMSYSLLFNGDKCYANAPHCYIICTLPVLLWVSITL